MSSSSSNSSTSSKPSIYLTVDKRYINLSATGGTEYITITCNDSWYFEVPKEDWCYVIRDKNKLKLIIKENITNINRNCKFKIKATLYNKEEIITINQLGKTNQIPGSQEIKQKGKVKATVSVSRNEVPVSHNKGREKVKVTSSNSNWIIGSYTADWLSLEKENDYLVINYKENKSYNERKYVINLYSSDYSKVTITITQKGKPEVKPSNFVMLNGGFTTLPDYSFGLTYSLVKTSGFYVSALSNFNFKFNADYIADSKTSINGTYPLYSGEKEYTKLTTTVGYVGRLGAPVYLYFGAGYGYRGLFYETVNKDWVEIQGNHCVYHGGVAEFGLMGNIYGFALSLGFSVICDLNNFGNYYPEAKVGIGYCF